MYQEDAGGGREAKLVSRSKTASVVKQSERNNACGERNVLCLYHYCYKYCL
jgi:hypothetical protein